MDLYNADFRENDSIYLIRQSQELLEIAKANSNSNAIIYACLDTRIALEILDLRKVLLSVDSSTRVLILKDSKPKNGIDKMGKKTGSLKEKYQLYFQAVCEVMNINDKYYDFKKSKEIQHKLSTYIHSYYMLPDEINYNSSIMQNSFSLLTEAHNFIKSSLHNNGQEYELYGIDIYKIPDEDKIILKDWKENKIDYDELKFKLNKNKLARKNS